MEASLLKFSNELVKLSLVRTVATLQARSERQGLQNRRESEAQVIASFLAEECTSTSREMANDMQLLCRFLDGYSKVDEVVRNGYSEVDRRFHVGEKAGDVANRYAI